MTWCAWTCAAFSCFIRNPIFRLSKVSVTKCYSNSFLIASEVNSVQGVFVLIISALGRLLPKVLLCVVLICEYMKQKIWWWASELLVTLMFYLLTEQVNKLISYCLMFALQAWLVATFSLLSRQQSEKACVLKCPIIVQILKTKRACCWLICCWFLTGSLNVIKVAGYIQLNTIKQLKNEVKSKKMRCPHLCTSVYLLALQVASMQCENRENNRQSSSK